MTIKNVSIKKRDFLKQAKKHKQEKSFKSIFQFSKGEGSNPCPNCLCF